MKYVKIYLNEAKNIIDMIDNNQIVKIKELLTNVRSRKGRVFILGVGGGAGHASHAVNDFRKICGIEAYTPTDNVSELTARVNDDGWDTSYANWLRISNLNEQDLIFVFSVGGGNLEKNISVNILKSLQLAKKRGSQICGVVGRDGGYTAQVADACVVIPTVNSNTVTPHTESFQAVIWHLLVSHPDLKRYEMKWESVK